MQDSKKDTDVYSGLLDSEGEGGMIWENGHAGDPGSIPGSGSSGEGNGNPLQYPCLENPMDRGAWRATVHGVTKRVRHNLVTK